MPPYQGDDLLELLEGNDEEAKQKFQEELRRAKLETENNARIHGELAKSVPPPVGSRPGGYTLASNVYLEGVDPGHRGGMWLKLIYGYWDTTKDTIPFWQYVEKVKSDYTLFSQIAQLAQLDNQAPLATPRHFELFKAGVKYVMEEEKRKKYRVTLGPRLMRRNVQGHSTFLDTEEIWNYYKGKYAASSPCNGLSNAQKNAQKFGVTLKSAAPVVKPVNMLSKTGPGDAQGWLIWVWGRDDNFYTHVGKLGRFHHSSFFAGGAVKGAGEWKVERGKLTGIVGLSGHYKPPFEALVASVKFLQSKHAVVTEETNVYLWEKGTGVPKPILAQAFLAKPQLYKDSYDFHEK